MTDGTRSIHRIHVLRLSLTGAMAAVLFFLFCWVGAQVPLGTLSHMYVQLFTNSDLSSTAALIEGSIWSLGFGLIGGALVAWAYNSLAPLERK